MLMKFFNKAKEEEIARLHALLREAQTFVMHRGCYFYSDDMRGPGSDLVKRIEKALTLPTGEYFGDK